MNYFLYFLLCAWLLKALDLIFGMLFLLPKISPQKQLAQFKYPKISVIFAAKNEEKQIQAAVESMLALDYPDYEVIAVNDRSSDSTGNILKALQAQFQGRLCVVNVETLPSGWLGKNHALYQGYKASSGQWILFTDADVNLCADTLTSAVHTTVKYKLKHLTFFPQLEIKHYIEAMFTDYFAIVFNFRYRPWMARFKWTLAYAGIGAFNFVERQAYELSGTHEAIALDVADDISLGKIIKRHGYPQMIANGSQLIRVRWVEGFKGVMQSLQKNAFRGLNYSVLLLVLGTMSIALMDILPFIGVFIFHGTLQMLSISCVAVILMIYLSMLKYNPRALRTFVAHPISAFLMIVILWRSALSALISGEIHWRDTTYSLKELKQKGVC